MNISAVDTVQTVETTVMIARCSIMRSGIQKRALGCGRTKRLPEEVCASLSRGFGLKTSLAISRAADRQKDGLSFLLAGVDIRTGVVSFVSH